MVKYEKDNLSDIFYALADPTRREIIQLVSKKQRKASGLAEHFSMSFPAVSKHIRILERAGFIARNVNGREHWFSLEDKSMKKALKWISFYRRFWLGKMDDLDQYLKNAK